MKRTTVVVLIAAVVLSLTGVIFWTGLNAATQRTMRREWPANLGSVASLAAQYPKQSENEDATQLVMLTDPLAIELAPGAKRQADATVTKIGEFVRQEQGKATRDVAAPPAEVAQYLASHAAELDAVREHLLRANITWPSDLSKGAAAPIPNLLGHLQLTRVLVARALTNRSWDDLHAAWVLSKSLQSRPETITQLIALAQARTVNAAAWKLPAPAPAWLAEMNAVDHGRLLARSLQAESWIASQLSSEIPFGRFAAARVINSQLDLTRKLLANQDCSADFSKIYEEHADTGGFGAIFTPNLAAAWRRAMRHRVEREATMNALRVAAGEPIVAKSACSNGSWRLENGTLAFSATLPKSERQEVEMPLSLRVSE